MANGKEVQDRSTHLPLRARLRRAFCAATGTCCRLEMQSGRAMIVQGCCGIEEYNPNCIVLSVRDPELSRLCICGDGLLCSSYHTDGVEIRGRITRMELCRVAPDDQNH
ncbi:MAG: YabP/YqfC family sporulation protein [Clostridia bacterium]|nr:YabP/YqfC family sporulation protein [Clostridia bacterium]